MSRREQNRRDHGRNRDNRNDNRITKWYSQLEQTRRKGDSSEKDTGRDGYGGIPPRDMQLRPHRWSEQSQQTPDYLTEDLFDDVDESSLFTKYGSGTTDTRNPGNWSEDRNNYFKYRSLPDLRNDGCEEISRREIWKYSDNQRRMSNTSQRHSDSFEDDHLRRSPPRQVREDDEEGNIDVAAHVMRLLMDFGGSLEVSRLEKELYHKLSITFHKYYKISRFLRRFKSQFTVVASRFAEEGEVGKDMVEVRTNLELCMTHSSNFKTCNGECSDLHICKFYILSECKSSNCKFGHSLHSEHNTEVLRRHGLHYLGRDHLSTLLKKIENRRGVTIPPVCKFYNSNSCKKENCPFLHICKNLDRCSSSMTCARSHCFTDNKPARLLSKYGLDPTTQKSDIFRLLEENVESVLPFTRNSDSRTSLQKVDFGASSSPEITADSEIHWSIESDQEGKIEFNNTEASDMERRYTKYLEAKQQWIKIAGQLVKVDFSKFEGVLVYKSKDTQVQLYRETNP